MVGGDDDDGVAVHPLRLQFGQHLLKQLVGIEDRVLVAVLQFLQVLRPIGGRRIEVGKLRLERPLHGGGQLVVAGAGEIDQREPGALGRALLQPLLPVGQQLAIVTLFGDKHLFAQTGEDALAILLGIFHRAEQPELVILAQHLVEQHRRTLVAADVLVVVTGQPVEEAEHAHQVVVAATQVIAERQMLIRIALQIGHVDVVEHVKTQ